MPDTKDKPVISSFTAPTEEDLAYFASLSFEEHRALVHAELDKGFEGETVPWTAELGDEILARAVERVLYRHCKD